MAIVGQWVKSRFCEEAGTVVAVQLDEARHEFVFLIQLGDGRYETVDSSTMVLERS